MLCNLGGKSAEIALQRCSHMVMPELEQSLTTCHISLLLEWVNALNRELEP
jgi:hypothetical protein